MLNDIELLLKDGDTGNTDVIDKSDIEERVDNDNVGLEYDGALPVYVLALAKAVNVYALIEGRNASTSLSVLTNVTVSKVGTAGGTAAIDKSVIVGVVPKTSDGST